MNRIHAIIHNVKFTAEYREETNIVHVLDLANTSEDAHKTVTNGIEEIAGHVMNKLELGDDPREYTWFLYGTDGVVSIFNFRFTSFHPVDKTSGGLIPEFVDVMETYSDKY